MLWLRPGAVGTNGFGFTKLATFGYILSEKYFRFDVEMLRCKFHVLEAFVSDFFYSTCCL